MTVVVLRHPEPGEPTSAQKEAGNYRKRKVEWRGLTISIENEGGTFRRGRAHDGTEWATLLPWSYGYVNGSMGVDGDHVDVYLGPYMDTAEFVHIVHQRRYDDWEEYDEDKCFIGFMTVDDAIDAFLACYHDPRFLGPVSSIPVNDFVRQVQATKDAPAPIGTPPVVLLLGS